MERVLDLLPLTSTTAARAEGEECKREGEEEETAAAKGERDRR